MAKVRNRARPFSRPAGRSSPRFSSDWLSVSRLYSRTLFVKPLPDQWR